jgi:hypothetical protein
MNLTTIRTNLAALVETNVTPYSSLRYLNAHPRRPRSDFRFPLFYLTVAEGPDHNRTNGGATADGGLSRVVFTGRLLVGSADSARDLDRLLLELDYYRVESGVGSVWAALMSSNTLSGAASGVLVGAWAGLETIEENDEDLVGDEVEIAVDAI